jgi:hypothetical protein
MPEMKCEGNRTNTAPSVRLFYLFNSQNIDNWKAYFDARLSQLEFFIYLIKIRGAIKKKGFKGAYVFHYF